MMPEQSMLGYSEVPKVVLIRSAAVMLMGLWVMEWALASTDGRANSKPLESGRGTLRLGGGHWVLVLALAFLGFTFLSTVFSPIWKVSIWGHDPGFDGYGFYNVASYIAIFAVIAAHVRTQAQIQRILWAAALSGTLVGGYAIAQHFGVDPFIQHAQNVNRAPSSLGNPIFAGSFLLMAILATMTACLWTSDGKWGWRPGLVVIGLFTVEMAGLAFTLSRGPWVGTAVGAATFMVATLVFCGRRRFLPLLVVVAASAGMAFAITLIPTGASDNNSGSEGSASSRVASIYDEVTSGSFTGRVNWWRQAANLIVSRNWYDQERFPELPGCPNTVSMYLLGTGPESLDYVLPLAETSHTTSGRASHAHNFILQDLAELGILGLTSRLAFLASLILISLVWLWRSRKGAYSFKLQMALILTCSVVIGRTAEQLVGVPRVADTALFWALSGVGVAAIFMMSRGETAETQTKTQKPQRPPQVKHWKFAAGFAVAIGCLVLVWQTNLNHFQAAVNASASERNLEAGDLSTSLAQIDRSVGLASEAGPYQIKRALTLKALSDVASKPQDKYALLAEAYEGLETGVRYNPMDHRVWARLGEFASYLAQYDPRWHEKSVRNYEVLTQLLPKYWQSHTVLASAQLKAKQTLAAFSTLQTSASLSSDESAKAQTLYLLGWALRDLGQIEESAAALEASIAIEPNPYAQSMLEDIYTKPSALVSGR
jgi:O-antigen ligase